MIGRRVTLAAIIVTILPSALHGQSRSEPGTPDLPVMTSVGDPAHQFLEARMKGHIDRLTVLDAEIKAADAMVEGLLDALTLSANETRRAALLAQFDQASARLHAALKRFEAEVDRLGALAQGGEIE